MKILFALVIFSCIACNNPVNDAGKTGDSLTSKDPVPGSMDTGSSQMMEPQLDLPEAWKAKKEKGIDILGIGNEPFWSVEIDRQTSITFNMMDWQKPQLFPAVKPVESGTSSVYEVSSADGKRIRITISRETCSDGMSDRVYTHKLTVNYENQQYNGCAVIMN